MSGFILLALYAAALGLVVGSYLNVVIYRVPRDLSTIRPRSSCPACGTPIRALDNIPVVSYALLGGKCRSCKAPIPLRYPLVEAATGALFLASFLRFGPTLEALAAAVLCALLVALALIDVEHFLLPDVITLPGIAVGLAFSPWLSWGGLKASLLGALVGGGILLALWGGWYLLRKEEGMGLGDVKMLAMVGAFLGVRGVLVTLLGGSILGSIVGLLLMSKSEAGLKSKLPFGTFLALGALLALFVGPNLVRLYLAQF